MMRGWRTRFFLLFFSCAAGFLLVSSPGSVARRLPSPGALFVSEHVSSHLPVSVVESSPSGMLDILVISETPVPSPTLKPSPTPSLTLPILSRSELDGLFTRYSNEQSVDPQLLRNIAVCESGLNPRAVNGPYAGLFQFSEHAWVSTRRVMNRDTRPSLRFNPEEAIRTAAFVFATRGTAAWPNCPKVMTVSA